MVEKNVKINDNDELLNMKTFDQNTANDILNKYPTYIKISFSQEDKLIPFYDDETLAVFRELKLTKSKYELLRKRFKEKYADILPPVQSDKKD